MSVFFYVYIFHMIVLLSNGRRREQVNVQWNDNESTLY